MLGLYICSKHTSKVAVSAKILFRSSFSTLPTDEVTSEKAERFNKIVDVYSPKVVSNITLSPGEKVILCRCWLSSKFPLCDGSHGKHNKATGDNLGPVVVTVSQQPKAQDN
uniref:Iron-binding zinc finger CDGSH type domain-containing protein n=1 Tax=Spumella elongata TaxID=89044 RepID=A0A7S3M390_9STRA|mmetsp:Transcript_24407/g.42055  ORF Transcript_24407/g.42055 Transcript_24407/m.42055 type:complete len:111 (+) Transcript_24407:63-395(+)